MNERTWKTKAAWVGALSGSLFFGIMPLLAWGERAFYQRSEPFFLCPLKVVSNTVRLRNDSYGDGRFGASRNGRRMHQGIDLAAAIGEPVFSSKSGRVTWAGENKGYGKYIELSHPDGHRTRYAHLSAIQVREGAWVVKNQIIGASGKTGNANHASITPHLHFEIRNKQTAVNPVSGLLDPTLTIK